MHCFWNYSLFVIVLQLVKSKDNIKRLRMKLESKPSKDFEFDDGKVTIFATFLFSCLGICDALNKQYDHPFCSLQLHICLSNYLQLFCFSTFNSTCTHINFAVLLFFNDLQCYMNQKQNKALRLIESVFITFNTLKYV